MHTLTLSVDLLHCSALLSYNVSNKSFTKSCAASMNSTPEPFLPPSEILLLYRQVSRDWDVFDHDNAEELLVQTLNSLVLEDLPPTGRADWEKEKAGEVYCNSGSFISRIETNVDILGRALSKGAVIEIDAEWDAVMKLVRLIITNRVAKPHSACTLRVAMDQSLNSWGDEKSRALSTKAILLVLIAVDAVQSAASDCRVALTSKSQTKPIRWRRLSSLAMECGLLFQRNVLFPLTRIAAGNTDLEPLVQAGVLFCRYVAPAVLGMICAIREGINAKATRIKPVMIESGLVASATILLNLINTTMVLESKLASDLTLEICQCAILPLHDICLESVLAHPTRFYTYQLSEMEKKNVNKQDVEIGGGTIYQAFTFDTEYSREDFMLMGCSLDCSVDYCGIDTRWDSAGIAFMAYRGLVARSTLEVDDVVSKAFSPRQLFALFYPHVEVLLLLGQSDESAFNDETKKMFTWTGLDMLRLVLGAVETKRVRTELVFANVEGPLGAVGLIQLLLNKAIALSDEGASVTCPSQVVEFTKTNILGQIRELLRCYSPRQHIQSIQCLLARCPFPFLEAVLLDLIRPALILDTTALPFAAKSNGIEIEEQAMVILRPYIDGIQRHIVRGSVLVEMDHLLDSVEQYTCAASLLRLICLRRKRREDAAGRAAQRSDVDKAVAVMNEFHSVLEIFLETDLSPQFFALNLLHNSLHELRASTR